jgi:DNA-binding protein HU-beta
MNKNTLIEHLSQETEISKADATRFVDALIDAIETTLTEGGKVTISGFGTFSVSDRAARTGRNPQTGEAIEIKAHRVSKFKPAKDLLDE